MRRRFLPFCLLLLCLTVTAHAAPFTYRDDFAGAASEEKSCQNILYRTINGEQALAFAGFASEGKPAEGYSASVTYRLEGVASVRLGLYTQAGTFVQQDPIYGTWVLGVGSYENSPSALLGAPRAVMGTGADGTRGIYALIGEQYHRLFWDSTLRNYCFYPSDSAPYQPTDRKGYGVNVYADGKPVSLNRSAVSYYSLQRKCYEEFTGTIPSGTASITVEINDTAVFPEYPSGGEQRNPSVRTGGLAFVELSGEEIQPQEPIQRPEEVEKPSPSLESSSSKASGKSQGGTAVGLFVFEGGSSSKSSSSSSKAASSSSSSKTSSAKASSSKFEGSPMPLSSSSVAASARSAQGGAAGGQAVEAAAAQPAIYQVERTGKQGSSYLTGAVVYVVLAAAAILAIILRGSKRE